MSGSRQPPSSRWLANYVQGQLSAGGRQPDNNTAMLANAGSTIGQERETTYGKWVKKVPLRAVVLILLFLVLFLTVGSLLLQIGNAQPRYVLQQVTTQSDVPIYMSLLAQRVHTLGKQLHQQQQSCNTERMRMFGKLGRCHPEHVRQRGRVLNALQIFYSLVTDKAPSCSVAAADRTKCSSRHQPTPTLSPCDVCENMEADEIAILERAMLNIIDELTHQLEESRSETTACERAYHSFQAEHVHHTTRHSEQLDIDDEDRRHHSEKGSSSKLLSTWWRGWLGISGDDGAQRGGDTNADESISPTSKPATWTPWETGEERESPVSDGHTDTSVDMQNSGTNLSTDLLSRFLPFAFALLYTIIFLLLHSLT